MLGIALDKVKWILIFQLELKWTELIEITQFLKYILKSMFYIYYEEIIFPLQWILVCFKWYIYLELFFYKIVFIKIWY